MAVDRKTRIEWPTMAMIFACYGGFAATGLLIAPHSLIAALIVMGVLSAFHSSLQHEVLHGHPTRSVALNEALVFLPLAPFYPYRRYKALHLKHHCDERLTDPYDDPESYYLDGRVHAELPFFLKVLLQVNNTMAGRVVIGPALGLAGFLASEMRRLWRGDVHVVKAWVLHGIGLAMLIAVLQLAMGISPILYLAVSGYLGASLIAIRTFCEHRAVHQPEARTAIVEKSVLSLLFLNNNLHVLHHAMPRVPWYRLPDVMAAEGDTWRERNGHYVFRSYWEIFRRYGFRTKEPVVHPGYPEPGGQAAPPAQGGIGFTGQNATP